MRGLLAVLPTWRRRSHRLLDADPLTYWSTDDGQVNTQVTLEFASPISLNLVRLREHLPLGQRVDAFALQTRQSDGWQPFGQGSAIGNCRLVRGETTKTRSVRLEILGSAACPALQEMGIFFDREAEDEAPR